MVSGSVVFSKLSRLLNQEVAWRTLPARRFLLLAGSRDAADKRIPSLRLSRYGLLHPSRLIVGFGR
jgi:hypothetical protein